MAGLFISFEGPEGSGKTTHIHWLSARLQAQGWPVLTTREPGGTRIGDAVRAILLDPAHTEMSPRAETLLFNAARAQLVDQEIRPALEQGRIVLCDRYADSTLAYQGYGHGQPLEELQRLIHYATGGLAPHHTIYLDLPPEVGLGRRRNRQGLEWNRLDAQVLAFHRRVRQGYLALAAQEPERWLVVDATRPLEAVQEEIWRHVRGWLPPLPPHPQEDVHRETGHGDRQHRGQPHPAGSAG